MIQERIKGLFGSGKSFYSFIFFKADVFYCLRLMVFFLFKGYPLENISVIIFLFYLSFFL